MNKKMFSYGISICCLFLIYPIFLVWLCNYLNPYDRLTEVLKILKLSLFFFALLSAGIFIFFAGIGRKFHSITKVFPVFDIIFIALMILALVFPVSHTLFDGQLPVHPPLWVSIKQFAVLIAVFAFVAWCYKRKLKQFYSMRNVLGIFSVLFICYATFTLYSEENKRQMEFQNASPVVSVGDKNVFLLIVETLQGSYFEELFKCEPELFKDFTGATLYSHAITSVTWSPFSANQIFTGNDNWHIFEKRSDAIEALKENSLLSDAEENNYKFNGGSYTPIQGFYINPYTNDIDFSLQIPRLSMIFVKYYCAAIRRIVPAVLWRKIYKFENRIFNKNLMAGQYPNKIAARDTFIELQNHLEYDKDSSAFFYNFNYMTHREILFDRNGKSIPNLLQNKENQLEEYRYVLSLYGNFLNKLKEMGVYDNSLIIMTGDHGTYDEQYRNYNPMLIVKPPQSSQALSLSHNAVMLTDIRQLIKSFMQGNEEFETAYNTFQQIGLERAFKVYASPQSDPENGTKYLPILINGDINTVYNELTQRAQKKH